MGGEERGFVSSSPSVETRVEGARCGRFVAMVIFVRSKDSLK